MLADDLLVRVALEALRASVPARDPTLRIEHVDGVVLDALNQQAEALLTLIERFLGGLALAQVAGDLGIANELAILTADRVDQDVRPHQ